MNKRTHLAGITSNIDPRQTKTTDHSVCMQKKKKKKKKKKRDQLAHPHAYDEHTFCLAREKQDIVKSYGEIKGLDQIVSYVRVEQNFSFMIMLRLYVVCSQ